LLGIISPTGSKELIQYYEHMDERSKQDFPILAGILMTKIEPEWDLSD